MGSCASLSRQKLSNAGEQKVPDPGAGKASVTAKTDSPPRRLVADKRKTIVVRIPVLPLSSPRKRPVGPSQPTGPSQVHNTSPVGVLSRPDHASTSLCSTGKVIRWREIEEDEDDDVFRLDTFVNMDADLPGEDAVDNQNNLPGLVPSHSDPSLPDTTNSNLRNHATLGRCHVSDAALLQANRSTFEVGLSDISAARPACPDAAPSAKSVPAPHSAALAPPAPPVALSESVVNADDRPSFFSPPRVVRWASSAEEVKQETSRLMPTPPSSPALEADSTNAHMAPSAPDDSKNTAFDAAFQTTQVSEPLLVEKTRVGPKKPPRVFTFSVGAIAASNRTTRPSPVFFPTPTPAVS